ncbi:oligosaccharide flippase family protein [Acinetobacter sp. Lyrl_1]|uniref:oligosaccharide flippase family protein n=1 Tax=Acinetobacter sp. Lyrl_1 TaxID=3110920 RepID=UPI003F7C770E
MYVSIKKVVDDPRIRNSMWMLIEKAISLFGLIFVISAVAKYTGPTIYGEIALAGSIFLVVKPISQLGLDQIYFKYVSQNKPFIHFFFTNSLILITYIYIFISSLVLIFSWFNASLLGFIFIVATAIAYYFNSIDLSNAYFEGTLRAKFNVLANIVGLIVTLILRYLIVIFEFSYYYLAIPIVTMTLIPFLIKLNFYNKNIKKIEVGGVKFRKKYYKYFFGVGIPLTLSVLASVFNSQIANYIIAILLDVKNVGFYNVAFILAGAWCIVCTTLILSYMTSIYSIATSSVDEYIAFSRKIFYFIFFIAVFFVFFLIFSAEYIVLFLYGEQYFPSVQLFKILLFGQLFWVLNFFLSRLIIKYSGYRFLAVKTIMALFFNFILCINLIPKCGVNGAAYAVTISELLSLIFCFGYGKAYILQIVFNLKFRKFKRV